MLTSQRSLVTALAALFALGGCAKPRLEGIYADGGTGFRFTADGTVQVLIAAQPNAGSYGSYEFGKEEITVKLTNGSMLRFKPATPKAVQSLTDLGTNRVFTLTDEATFKERGKPSKEMEELFRLFPRAPGT